MKPHFRFLNTYTYRIQHGVIEKFQQIRQPNTIVVCFPKIIKKTKNKKNKNSIETISIKSDLIVVRFFEVFRPTRDFFTHSEMSPFPVNGCNFCNFSALMAIEQ